MKKFYAFILAAFACMAANAQQKFGFENAEVQLADGDLVTVYAEEVNFGEDDDPWWIVECVPAIKVANYSNEELLIAGTATVDVPGFMQWCFGGNCTQFGTQTSLYKSQSVPAGEKVALQLEPQCQLGNYMERNATVELSAGGETHNIKIKYIYAEAEGIYNATLQQKDNTIYNLAGQRVNKAERGVYIVGGKKVLR